MRPMYLSLAALGLLGGCSVWPVNQDPAGMEYRREANQIIDALQDYRRDTGNFPPTLAMLTPSYLQELPHVPALTYRPSDGSLRYAYSPSWPQLRPVRCAFVVNGTEVRCPRAIHDRPR